MKIKRMTLTDLILALIVWVAVMIPLGVVGHYETHYTMDCIVIEVEKDLVTVVDVTGEEWQFFAEDLQINDTVKVNFKQYGQSSRYDDIIVDFQKI